MQFDEALGEEEIPVRGGGPVARPAGTGVAHMFRAGDGGLRYLAHGTWHPGHMCDYSRSTEIAFSGLGVIARPEKRGYWDGED